ncbi:MAG: acyl-CoA dehydrogenase family protein [Chloroflexota bacterium]
MAEESEKLQALRQEVRAWLRANLPKGWGTPEYVPHDRTSLDPKIAEEARVFGKQWQKKLYEAGYTGFGIPKEYGGEGFIERSQEEQQVINEEMARTGTPQGMITIGPMIVIPTILRHGKEWQKKRFVSKMLNGDEAWCECFSEPDAGSDLANIQTTAVRDGDNWIINGQKVWTNMARFADWAVVPVRTDLKAPRHRNLSFFLVDAHSKGFEVRPLPQITGTSLLPDAEFNEVFFTDVRVPNENMVGEEGKGWGVCMTTLEFERGGGFGQAGARTVLEPKTLGGVEDFVELAKETKRQGKAIWENPVFRQRIAQFAIENEALKWNRQRMLAKARKKQLTGFEQSIGSIFSREKNQRQANMVMEIIGAYSQLVKGDKRALQDHNRAYLTRTFLRTRANTIETGTTEVNRGIIAERLLGLPRTRQ